MFGLSGRARSVYKTCERQAARDTARGEANFPDSGVSKREYRISCGCEHPFFFFSSSLSPSSTLSIPFFFEERLSMHCNILDVGYEYSFVVCTYVSVCMNGYVTSEMGNVSRFLSSPSFLTDKTKLSNLESSTMSMPTEENISSFDSCI